MIFYRTPDGRWHRRQVENGEQIDVPTDKSGLLTFLNENVSSAGSVPVLDVIANSDPADFPPLIDAVLNRMVDLKAKGWRPSIYAALR